MTIIKILLQTTNWKMRLRFLPIAALCFFIFTGLEATAQNQQMQQLAKELNDAAENIDPNNIEGYFQKIKSITKRMANLLANQPDADADTKELGRQLGSMLNTNDPAAIGEKLERIMQLLEHSDQNKDSSKNYQEQKQREQLTKNDDPDDMTTLRGQSNHYDDWAKADAKKYPGVEKGVFENIYVTVTWGGMKGAKGKAQGVGAWVVNGKDWVSSNGCCMRIYNYTKFPVYFGIGGSLRDKLEPGEKRIVDLPVIYLPVDPGKRIQVPPREVTLEISYWVKNP